MCCPYDDDLGIKVRCLGQQIVYYDRKCPSSYICENESDLACPDGICVSNEIYCHLLPKCPSENPYRCQNNECVSEFNACKDNKLVGIKCHCVLIILVKILALNKI